MPLSENSSPVNNVNNRLSSHIKPQPYAVREPNVELLLSFAPAMKSFTSEVSGQDCVEKSASESAVFVNCLLRHLTPQRNSQSLVLVDARYNSLKSTQTVLQVGHDGIMLIKNKPKGPFPRAIFGIQINHMVFICPVILANCFASSSPISTFYLTRSGNGYFNITLSSVFTDHLLGLYIVKWTNYC